MSFFYTGYLSNMLDMFHIMYTEVSFNYYIGKLTAVVVHLCLYWSVS